MKSSRLSARFKILVPGLLLLVAGGGCRAAQVTTTHEAVEKLFQIRRDFNGARSLTNVRVTGKGGQSFRASIAIDRNGDMAMSAFTPFGTTAAHVRLERDRITLINHLRNSYWEGRIEDLSGANALTDALRFRGLPFLLAGLPPWQSVEEVRQEVVSDELVRLSDDSLALITSRSGLVGGRLEVGPDEVNVRFAEPAIPPSKLEVSSSIDPTRIVQFEHLDLDFEPVSLDPLHIPDNYVRAEYWESVIR